MLLWEVLVCDDVLPSALEVTAGCPHATGVFARGSFQHSVPTLLVFCVLASSHAQWRHVPCEALDLSSSIDMPCGAALSSPL